MLYGANCIDATLPRKAAKARFMVLVPETDTGSQVENTKVREITLSKELGKITS
jgi:hypothetical protein